MKPINEEKISVEFGAFLREARERNGLHQEDIAEKLGVSRSYYAYIENGKRNIYFPRAINICRVLDLDMNDFIKTLK